MHTYKKGHLNSLYEQFENVDRFRTTAHAINFLKPYYLCNLDESTVFRDKVQVLIDMYY